MRVDHEIGQSELSYSSFGAADAMHHCLCMSDDDEIEFDTTFTSQTIISM